ncbi:MAG: ABC transporter permease subunit, partial [Chlorobi bacterium]|nr:ABC transporter permease subunit [Chlorobiota bacterium]
GMSKFQALRHIILPQAVRLVIPPVTNDFISLLKDSSLVSLIAITELTKVFLSFAARDFDFLGPGLMVAVIYLLIGLPFVKLAKIIEKRFSIDHRKTA